MNDESGLLIIGAVAFGAGALVIVAMIVTLLVARGNRGAKSCGVGCVGVLLGAVALIIATAVVTMMNGGPPGA